MDSEPDEDVIQRILAVECPVHAHEPGFPCDVFFGRATKSREMFCAALIRAALKA